MNNLKERRRILKSCHDHPTSGHFGISKTIHRISERFIWPGITNDVMKFVCTGKGGGGGGVWGGGGGGQVRGVLKDG